MGAQATTVKISSKGQVVIPKEVRNAFHWDSGTELTLLMSGDGVVLRQKPAKKQYTAKSLRGFLQYQGEAIPTEKLCQAVEYSEE